MVSTAFDSPARQVAANVAQHIPTASRISLTASAGAAKSGLFFDFTELERRELLKLLELGRSKACKECALTEISVIRVDAERRPVGFQDGRQT